MTEKERIDLLGYQYMPTVDTLKSLRVIVEEQTGDTRRLDADTCSAFFLVAVSAYNYGMMAGVRRERKRHRRIC